MDLHPSGFDFSEAWSVSGGQQVGYGWGTATGGVGHALLWSGTAESVVDLHPGGPEASGAWGISDGQQVGDVGGRAAIWSGTAESHVDIHPSGFDWSQAIGTTGTQQVGGGSSSVTNGRYHALLWSGTYDSVVDLHSYFPVEYDESYSVDIDSSGTIVGYAWDFQGIPFLMAVMWIPTHFVEIDIKPGSYPNSINLGSQGLIPVAILSNSEFDATTVDPDTVELDGADVPVRGKSNKYMAHKEDVDGDGLDDLVLQVATANFDPESFLDGYATLTGKTYDGIAIEGSDEIRIVPE